MEDEASTTGVVRDEDQELPTEQSLAEQFLEESLGPARLEPGAKVEVAFNIRNERIYYPAKIVSTSGDDYCVECEGGLMRKSSGDVRLVEQALPKRRRFKWFKKRTKDTSVDEAVTWAPQTTISFD